MNHHHISDMLTKHLQLLISHRIIESVFSPKAADARGVQRATCSPLTLQPRKVCRTPHPSVRTIPLLPASPSALSPQQGWETALRTELTIFWRVRRTSPLPPPSRFPDRWLHPELAWGAHGNTGPHNTLQRIFLRGNSNTRLYEHISRRVANAPVRSNAPAGTSGKCSSHAPARQTKSGPRRPPGARVRGDTRRGGARRGLPPGAGGQQGNL